MQKLALVTLYLLLSAGALAMQEAGQSTGHIVDITRQQTYVAKRASSSDPLGANRDFRSLPAGNSMELLNTGGPGEVTHIWIALADHEPLALKRVVLRMYWDNEREPSVETPLGDFFGLGLGTCTPWHSPVLAVTPTCGLNSFFEMPYARHARITLTNEGHQEAWGVFYDVDYRSYQDPLPRNSLYFHAQYRQAQPTHGVTSAWSHNQDPKADLLPNLNGEANYVWMTANGHGQFIGVTMSVLQNQDGWWGEGDEMFFIDGETKPSITGTGAEDYFLGAGDFGGTTFDYSLGGATVVGPELAGSRSSMYRFHLESPIPFTKSLRATIEHGSANVRSDNYYTVAYWYQSEPHTTFPPLPAAAERLPRLQATGGPGAPETQTGK